MALVTGISVGFVILLFVTILNPVGDSTKDGAINEEFKETFTVVEKKEREMQIIQDEMEKEKEERDMNNYAIESATFSNMFKDLANSAVSDSVNFAVKAHLN